MVEEWNRDGRRSIRRTRCIHELFEAQAARTPDAVAVVVEEEALTYAELNARANRLAHHLRRAGRGPGGARGGLPGARPELVVALLARAEGRRRLRAAGPTYPAERLAYMLADSGARGPAHAGGAGGRARARRACAVARAWTPTAEAIAAGAGDAPGGRGCTPENLAYVIYTSGSTGRPRGCWWRTAALVACSAMRRSSRAGARATCCSAAVHALRRLGGGAVLAAARRRRAGPARGAERDAGRGLDAAAARRARHHASSVGPVACCRAPAQQPERAARRRCARVLVRWRGGCRRSWWRSCGTAPGRRLLQRLRPHRGDGRGAPCARGARRDGGAARRPDRPADRRTRASTCWTRRGSRCRRACRASCASAGAGWRAATWAARR